MLLWLEGEEGITIEQLRVELKASHARPASKVLNALLDPPYSLVERSRGERRNSTTWDKARNDFKEELRMVALVLEEKRSDLITRTPDRWYLNERGLKIAERISDLRRTQKAKAAVSTG